MKYCEEKQWIIKYNKRVTQSSRNIHQQIMFAFVFAMFVLLSVICNAISNVFCQLSYACLLMKYQ